MKILIEIKNLVIFMIVLGAGVMVHTSLLNASDAYINQVQKKRIKPTKIQQIPLGARPFVAKRSKKIVERKENIQNSSASVDTRNNSNKVLSLPTVRGGATLDVSKEFQEGTIIILPSVRGGAVRIPQQ